NAASSTSSATSSFESAAEDSSDCIDPSKCSFGTGAALSMMADSHLVFNVLRTCHGDVRFGSKTGVRAAKSHVRFTPNSGREMSIRDLRSLSVALEPEMSALPPKADMQCIGQCPLWANSGHGAILV